MTSTVITQPPFCPPHQESAAGYLVSRMFLLCDLKEAVLCPFLSGRQQMEGALQLPNAPHYWTNVSQLWLFKVQVCLNWVEKNGLITLINSFSDLSLCFLRREEIQLSIRRRLQVLKQLVSERTWTASWPTCAVHVLHFADVDVQVFLFCAVRTTSNLASHG